MHRKRSLLQYIIQCSTLYLVLNGSFLYANKPMDITPEVMSYINHSWDVLTRHTAHLDDSSLDGLTKNTAIILYVPRTENLAVITDKIRKNTPEWERKDLVITYLPENSTEINEHGLLYLPYPYVVPGGRFNEMYGWDSYFIELGLLKSNRLSLAKGMVDNMLYEIRHYGTILNANRTYYLTRSQPPFLTEMILAYYEKAPDKKWLASTLPAIEKLYRYWTTPPHIIPDIGLSRYYALGHGPAPEESPMYYKKVTEYFRTHEITDYDKRLYYNNKNNTLTDLFYVADRTVRESGLDISAKYGPLGAAILDYAPVDLNVLLYKLEIDTSVIYSLLNETVKSNQWKERANKRIRQINTYLWSDQLGYYFDYNYKTHQSRPYTYATTFYPLWAGIASQAQAAAVAGNTPNLLAAGGILMSNYRTKLQWDAPFGWAPFQYFAFIGLKQYGYHDLAVTIAARFVKTINDNFEKYHVIFEKYDVQSSGAVTKDKIDFSYNSNEVGFGWTNAVYLELVDSLAASH